MAERINTDSLSLTRDEAVELCVHHLRLAALFFEVTPDDGGKQLQEEIKRTCKQTINGTTFTDTWQPAGEAFVRYITSAYNALKDLDGPEEG